LRKLVVQQRRVQIKAH